MLRVRQRDGRRDHAAADATPRRPRGARRRRVRRHVSAPHPGAGSVGPRDDDVRPGRRRRARRRDPPDDPLRLGGDPVEPAAEGRRHPGRRRARPRVGLPGRGRQHVRLARAAAAAAARRRRRGPQRDEVRRRSLRPDRRRDRDERGGPDRRDRVPRERRRCGAGSDGRVPRAAWPAHPRRPDAPTQRERCGDRRVPRRPSDGQPGVLSRSARPRGPRHRRGSDGRLRRDGLLHGRLRRGGDPGSHGAPGCSSWPNRWAAWNR